jgi:hypothetical protein
MIHPTRLLLCLFAAAACSGTGARSDGAIAVEVAATAMQDTHTKTDRAIPLIDALAPAACQTATFALG